MSEGKNVPAIRHTDARLGRLVWLHRRANRRHGSGSASRSAVLLVATLPLVGILLVPLLAGAIAATGVIAYEHIAAGLPDLAALTRSSLPQTTRFYDRTGQHVLATLYTQDRDYVSYDQIPATVVAATVAIEDRGFWTNPGVDFGAVVRAALNNANGDPIQGGSTITQQLVKQLLVGDQETLDRKIREAVFAMKASQVLSKTETMELYLNTVYYGEQAYGIAAAARRYFGEHLDQLDLAQTALLAGLPQAPSELDPFQNPGAAKQRQLVVLDSMLETGVITKPEHDAAAREPWRLQRYVQQAEQIPWFTDRAIEEAAALMGGRDKLASCGCMVITTLDWSLQAIAQRDVTQFIKGLPSSDNVHNAALVAENPSNGEVLAYVGSVDPNDNSPQVRGRFDAAGVGLRSPGSTWKAVTYLSAMEAGHLTDTSRLWDVSTDFAPGQLTDPALGTQTGFRAQDADGSTNGPITIRQAIRESRNIPAIRAMLAYGGIAKMIQMASRLGVETPFGPTEQGPSLAIGTHSVTLTDMTAVYSTISNLGLRVTQHKILRIQRPDGTVVLPEVSAVHAVDARLAWTFLDILKDNANKNASWLTGAIADLGRPAAVKTGTETDVRDTYTVGMVPQLTVGVWVGNTDNSPMAPTFHSYNGPLEIWHTYMSDATAAKQWPPSDWTRPPGMQAVTVCADLTMYGGWGFDQPPGPGCPTWRTATSWVMPGFNDPATRLTLASPPFGTYRTDGFGYLLPAQCTNGYLETGVLAQAEIPAFQPDLTAWVMRARAGEENHGRFPWSSVRWILPARSDSCDAPPPAWFHPRPPPTPSPSPDGGGDQPPAPSAQPGDQPTPAPSSGPPAGSGHP